MRTIDIYLSISTVRGIPWHCAAGVEAEKQLACFITSDDTL